ncbi:MAG TPA: hypothetical protein DF383_01000 [Deltaproteobacteria bacterium]|nr:hypothetical protein [Deltaproteobacteria bacterium]
MKTLYPSRKELRHFGLLVGGIFALLFGLLLPFLWGKSYPRWPWWVGAPLFFFALFFPSALKVPHRIWTLLGEVLNWINTRIILSLLFFLVFTPIGLFLKISGKDPLRRRRDPSADSYRTRRGELLPGQMERPF